jgi:hypothetical protein
MEKIQRLVLEARQMGLTRGNKCYSEGSMPAALVGE